MDTIGCSWKAKLTKKSEASRFLYENKNKDIENIAFFVIVQKKVEGYCIYEKIAINQEIKEYQENCNF